MCQDGAAWARVARKMAQDGSHGHQEQPRWPSSAQEKPTWGSLVGRGRLYGSHHQVTNKSLTSHLGGHQVTKGAPRVPRWPKMAPRCDTLGPRWSQDGAKMGHTGPQINQDGPKMGHTGPQMAQDGPKMRHTGPKMEPR